jgi:hypothetical protein
MKSSQREREAKITKKLAGLGIESTWTREAFRYMEENGFGLNQISTKVAPYIRQKIALESERNNQEELAKKIKLFTIQNKYIGIRNAAFAEIFREINSGSLNLNSCREISNGLLAKKMILWNKWDSRSLISVLVLSGVLYGLLYWKSEFFKNASDLFQKVILCFISGVVALPKALKMFRPIELNTSGLFAGTNLSLEDIEQDIRKIDNSILKLIEHSLKGNEDEFDKVLKNCTILINAAIPPVTPDDSSRNEIMTTFVKLIKARYGLAPFTPPPSSVSPPPLPSALVAHPLREEIYRH